MKKFAFILASILLIGAAASCEKSGSDKDGKSGGDSKNPSTKVEIKLTANFNADYFRYADFKVKYTEGGSTKTEDLTAPAENSRSNWTKTLAFTSEADVVFEVVCTPKSVTYETATKTVSGRTFEYVVFNTNALVNFEVTDYDASGKQLGDSYGTVLKNEENKIDGKVSETHGAGAESMNYNALAIKINGEKSNNFIERNLVSYKCHYKIVKGADGLTAESAE